jgi:hemolysin D
LQRAELEVALSTGLSSLDALRAQLAAEQEAVDALADVAKQTTRAAGARVSMTKKTLEFKEKEAAIAAQLRDAAAISGLDALRSLAAEETQRAQLWATAAQARLDTRTSTMNVRDRNARLATVRYLIAQAQAETEKLRARIDTLSYEIDRRRVRAFVDGTLVDVMPISAGMTITSQQRLATILPEGVVRVLAFMSPSDSIGRVRAGQAATLRVENFPWTQFGTVGAVVEQVGTEPRDGSVRVELRIVRPNPNIPIVHGLTASCEVEVETLSPLKLLLRSAGHWVAAPPPPAPTKPDHERAVGAL